MREVHASEKPLDDLFDSRSSPRTESLVASAIQWAERIMRRAVDAVWESELVVLVLMLSFV